MKKEKTYNILIIEPAIGGIAIEELKALSKPLTLEENQKIVGGNIELVEVLYHGEKCNMLVNEDGLFSGCKYNAIATNYYKDLYRHPDEYDQEEVEGLGLVGTAILMIDHKLK